MENLFDIPSEIQTEENTGYHFNASSVMYRTGKEECPPVVITISEADYFNITENIKQVNHFRNISNMYRTKEPILVPNYFKFNQKEYLLYM
jgi:hypothetical protein